MKFRGLLSKSATREIAAFKPSKKNHNSGQQSFISQFWLFPLGKMGFSDGLKKHIVLCGSFFILYALASRLSNSIDIAGTPLRLYDLTLPVISALLILYNLRALPTLALFAVCSFYSHPLNEFLGIAAQLVAALVSSKLYFYATGKYGAVSFGRSQLSLQRICWLICFNTFLFILFHQWLLLKFHFITASDANIFSITTLLNIQWMLTSCLTGTPFSYLILRAFYKPAWFFNFLRQVKDLIVYGPRAIYQISWIALLAGIIYCLASTNKDILIFTDYTIIWLLPIMLWGSICLGHALINPIWVFMLILLGNYIDNYISVTNAFHFEHYTNHLALISSMIFIFSLTIVIVGVLATRIVRYIGHLKRVSLSEPHTGLPNLRALKDDIILNPHAGLCSIQCPELNSLTQTHGITFRFEFVKAVAGYIAPLLKENESIYYSPGYGILLRLNQVDETLIDPYYKAMSSFRFSWEEMELGLNFGIAYMVYENCISNLSYIVGQLYASTFVSLQQGKPQVLNMQQQDNSAAGPGEVRHFLQKALDEKSFMLVAQPIVSAKGDDQYHEILIRIKASNNKLFFPDTFLPLAEEAGLLAEVDMTVIEQAFRFMQSLDPSQENSRFSINLTPQSLIKTDFQKRLYCLFKNYGISPERIIFEIIESDIIDNINASKVLRELRNLGCKIAIDDFGTGASSYSRLKNLEADILKIDGSFIRNVVNEKFDHFIVKSFCEAAQFKKLEVVAEFVESEEIKQMLISMNVDWLQGYHTGKPVPVELLRK